MFKVGDRVICIDSSMSSGHLKENGIYIIEKFHIPSEIGPALVELSGKDSIWAATRFELFGEEVKKVEGAWYFEKANQAPANEYGPFDTVAECEKFVNTHSLDGPFIAYYVSAVEHWDTKKVISLVAKM